MGGKGILAVFVISIHSPHTRGDISRFCRCLHSRLISIHSPHTRGDALAYWPALRFPRFQSTPLMRGETAASPARSAAMPFQSTPLMRGETIHVDQPVADAFISIHSPHTRGDARPAGRPVLGAISIHSPLTREDDTDTRHWCRHLHFNPLPSHEGRLQQRRDSREALTFQSAPLSRGETAAGHGEHADAGHFNPLPSHEGRPLCRRTCLRHRHFNPLPSHEGRRATTQYGNE